MKNLLLSVLTLLAFSMPCIAQYGPLGNQIDGGPPNDNMGWSVAMNATGRIIAMGAPLYDNDFGQVRIYQESGGTWTQLGSSINGTEIANQFGFSIALNAAGTRVALGGLAGGTRRNGSVEVYDLVAGTWVQRGNTILGEAVGDFFGFSLDMNAVGTRIVVGARNNDGNGAKAGHVRVYEELNAATSSWVQMGDDIDGEAAGDEFGSIVTMDGSGNLIAVGAAKNDGAGTDAGHVRIFRWENSRWTQQGADLDGQNADEAFGSAISLSVDGTTLAASAPLHDYGTGFGSVRVYTLNAGNPFQIGTDIRENSTTETLGTSLNLSSNGSILAVGNQYNDDNAMSSGRVTIYQNNGGTWALLDPNPIRGNAIFDQLGKSVALNHDGNRVVIGANLASSTKGYVVVYQDSSRAVGLENDIPTLDLNISSTANTITIQSSDLIGLVDVMVVGLDGKMLLSNKQFPILAPRVELQHQLGRRTVIVAIRHATGVIRKKLVLN
ncbi:MAG: hypothetical protein AB8F95_16730 [Bacteroidia bacterium]